ncbi:hypothetical protein BB561_003498 [Smittium simulii]|uniref:Protein PNS1 n=1 Tax=Smittium simulii TaxID=133385 RepID=A0A2T9YKX5_9FUNG|nr:hypothetical protein BB561_003498 [Smittium simulii]
MNNNNFYGQNPPPNYQNPPPNPGYSNGQFPNPNQYMPQQQYQQPSNQQHPELNYHPEAQHQNTLNNSQQKYDSDPQYPPEPNPQIPIDSSEYFTGKIAKESKFRDWWAAVLFLLNFALFVFLAVLFIPSTPSISHSTDTSTNIFSEKSFIEMVISMTITIILSLLYMFLVHNFTKGIITVSFWTLAAIIGGLGVYYIIKKVYIAGGILLFFFVLYAKSWFGLKHAIPFTEAVLKSVLKIIRKFPSTIIVSLIFAIIVSAFNTAWYLTLTGSQFYMKKYETCTTKTISSGTSKQQCSNTSLTLTYIYLGFIYFWAIQVIVNVLHTTVCGLFATYYFYEGASEGYPTDTPLLSSLKRASIYSFGSICFGSLIVAILQIFRAIVEMFRFNNTKHIVLTILNIFTDYILGFIQGFIEYFNKYAYIEIAIYGKPFIKASKDTLRLLTSKGLMAVVNDCLTGNVFFMGSIIVSLFRNLLNQFVSTRILNSAVGNGGHGALLGFVGFVFGVSVFTTINGIIGSGSSTAFVCLAEDERAVARSDPDMYAIVNEKYPDVISGISR